MKRIIENKEQWKKDFMKACERGEIDDVRHLCQKKYFDLGWADVHGNNEGGFRWACYKGHLEIVKFLLTSPEIKDKWSEEPINAFGEAFKDIIFWTCFNGEWEVVRWLIFDYGIKKTDEIEDAIKKYPQAKEYFRVRDELNVIKGTVGLEGDHNGNEVKGDGRATKKAKKL